MYLHRPKNFSIIALLLLLTLFSSTLTACGKQKHNSNFNPSQASVDSKKNYYLFQAGKKYFQIWNGSDYEPIYLKGVNLGSGKPGKVPGELAITKQEYLNWFQQIADMNCNTIRVYTVMMPQFYEALYDYNATASKKLYLIQGVWYNEQQLENTSDAYDIYDKALEDACNLVDIFHGNAEIRQITGEAYGTYNCDVSEYVLAWLLGIESDAILVNTTNSVHADEHSYQGQYLTTTADASPYETFMCRLGDTLLTYEMTNYSMQRPISWCNWPTTDMLTHENEPDAEKEDAATINVEHIQATKLFKAGIFASYHIYPYYPEFMIEEGQDYIDENGNPNPYRAYLEKLITEHSIPVLVAEYGIPTSRGNTHFNSVTGYNQGNVNEEQQADMLVSMSKDIYESGYCGSLIFTWQDEWFKRTWNTMNYTNADRRAYWSDMQTSEQNFGLLAFDPGRAELTPYPDGSDKEWTADHIILSTDHYTLSAQKDARYLYLLIKGDQLNPESDRIILPIDVTPKSGSLQYETCHFPSGADFVIDLQGKNNSSIKVHGYYDRYPASYTADMDKTFDRSSYGDASSPDFHPIYLCLNRQLYFPVTQVWMDYRQYETGHLTYGNGSPDSADYNSLADFCYGENFIELRIPWGLLNFRDPSTKEVEDDFHATGQFSGLQIEAIQIGAGAYGELIPMTSYTWENWNDILYHERLKPSYYKMQSYFKTLTIQSD